MERAGNEDYEEDTEKVIELLRKEMKKVYEENTIEGLLAVPEVLGIEELGESSVKIKITADCRINTNWQIERELRLRIKKLFDKEGINIPYPQRTLHIKKEE